MLAIQTKFIASTPKKGARYKAFYDGRSVTVPYEEGAQAAAIAFLRKFNPTLLSRQIELVEGHTDIGEVYVVVRAYGNEMERIIVASEEFP